MVNDLTSIDPIDLPGEGFPLLQTCSSVLTLPRSQTYSPPSFIKRSLFKPETDDVMAQLTQLIVQGISGGAIHKLFAEPIGA
ncbi:MAG TPA: hypothetical protein VN280_11815 [Variovorax sp.]|nr:hypothetical protein [Variovorax sp.]